ncbi:hypothetical protein [Mucilaginibacter sp. NFR10]|uniref:hypothetical protein n=1 Tax=Mucilaginibacter sp. NFR10 TaxID=1566292 RepID=UPI00087176E5|nr:hypothetical protein [Mucilaginibacter sp. NFR10]SCW88342.1 hypothetical protein SAMN03159284_05372 [Mucilaginibacter sp. NFR10]
MSDKLDLIIDLLSEINENIKKLISSQPASPDIPPKPARKSKKQLFHEKCVAEIEADRPRQQARAKKMFAKEYERIETLERELRIKPNEAGLHSDPITKNKKTP